jgi:hypothetical protein
MTADSIWRVPGVVDRLRRLWDQGDSCSKIGDALGVSKNAIAGARRRCGLPPRGLPPALEGVKNKPRAGYARLGAGGVGGSRLAPPARQSLAEAGGLQPGPRAAAASAHDVSSLQTSAAGAAKPRPQLFVARGCQFPMWGDGERPEHGAARYCEAQPRRNAEGRQDSPYCVEHHAKCFVVPVKKVAA